MGDVASAVPSVGFGNQVAAWKWRVLGLMFFATMINYMDRQTMQAASPHLIRDFFKGDNKNAGYASVESAFNFAFAISLFVSGFLVDRFSVRWLYVGALLVWSAAGVCTGLMHTGFANMLVGDSNGVHVLHLRGAK